MNAHIKINKPNPVELSELRPGDNFEHPHNDGWVCKVITGIPDPQPSAEEVVYSVTESSGELMVFNHNEKVYPLLDGECIFTYDFDRNFEKDRD